MNNCYNFHIDNNIIYSFETSKNIIFNCGDIIKIKTINCQGAKLKIIDIQNDKVSIIINDCRDPSFEYNIINISVEINMDNI